MPPDGCSLDGMLSKFKDTAGRSGKMERSDQDYLYLFPKNVNPKCNGVLYYSCQI